MQLSAAAANVVADETCFLSIMQCSLYIVDSQIILISNVEVSLLRADRQGTDCKSFDHTVGISFKDGSVHESARVTFVSVAGYIFREVIVTESRAPFASCRETGSAAAAKARRFHFTDDFFRCHRQGFLEAFITSGRNIVLDFRGGDFSDIP